MSMDMPMPAHAGKAHAHKPAAKKPAPARHDNAAHADMESMPGMAMPTPKPAVAPQSKPAESTPMPGMDMPTNAATMPGMEPATPANAAPRTPLPPVTESDRAAAFPPVTHHAMHDDDIHSYVLLDRLESWNGDHGGAFAWEGRGWIGTDTRRLWLRSEGERADRATTGDAEILYGRSVTPWWDLVAGLREDFGIEPAQTRAAFGVQGTAPSKFEVEATAYLGGSQRFAARLEAEYELLLTNRLILQPRVELDFASRDDPQRRIGSGLGTAEAGLRLRYEITRQFAPYIGIVREQAYGMTARFERAAGANAGDTRTVAGLRVWF
jgi:copper resistance protein B